MNDLITVNNNKIFLVYDPQGSEKQQIYDEKHYQQGNPTLSTRKSITKTQDDS